MTKCRLAIVLAFALAMILPREALALQVGEPAPTFSLSDQFGKKWALSDLKNNVIVLVVANQESGRAMGPWVDNLKTKYGARIRLLGLLDLHSVPWFGRGIARSRIRRETKDPLMLDFNGATAKMYSVSAKYPVVVVIDKSSRIRGIQKINYTDNAFNSITTAIDEVLKSNARSDVH